MNPTESGRPRLRKFHIGTGQSDQEIIDQFVVRQNELKTILEVLEGNIGAESCQHLLVVAPRGRGKTTLLVRVMAELRTNDRLSPSLLPIRLMEESQEIFNLADFWLECLYYLAKSCVRSNKSLADELEATHAALVEDWTDKTLEGRARAAVLDAADRLDRKLVIMVENLQSLCDEADKDFGWSLRQVLQSEPQIMLLGTATSRFEALENAEEPFFEMFRALCLPPLNVEECRLLWHAISGETVDERGIRPLRILTGGSPRLMVVLASFTHDRSLRQLMEQLVNLIDDHTEYFRSQLEELASTERRVYIALIDLWQASTTSEIAARARMEVRTVSSLLGRLAKRGAVTIEGTGKKRTYYAAERLYSIYYKLRRDRDEAAVVRNLIRFMATYYQGDALAELSRGLVAEAFESEGIREGLVRAAAEMPELQNLIERHGLSATHPLLHSDGIDNPEALVEIKQRFENGDFGAVVRLVDQFQLNPASRSSMGSSVDLVTSAFFKGMAHHQLGELSEAVRTYAAVIEHCEDSEDKELKTLVAMALVNQGVAQGQLGNFTEAIETCAAVVKRFTDSESRELQEAVARALVNKGFTQGKLGDLPAAIQSYASVVERFGDSENREIQEAVARALVNQGFTQAQQGDYAAAIQTYAMVVERLGDSENRELQVAVAMATGDAGEILCLIGSAEDALYKVEKLRAHSRRSGLEFFLLRADWLDLLAHASAAEQGIMEDRFRAICSNFDPSDKYALQAFQQDLPTLVALGAAPAALARVMEENVSTHEALRPLVVALRLEAGETVRAPDEVLEVAKDIREEIESTRRKIKRWRNEASEDS